MTESLFFLLCEAIAGSYVSVHNDEFLSAYSFYIPTGIGEETLVNICSSYSHTDSKNSYVSYQLYLDEELVSSAIRPIFNKKTSKDKKQKISEADRLESLLALCSSKVIKQEYESQKLHMLKSFTKPNNQHTS